MSEEDGENLIILMIAASSHPIPSRIHIQKEMFLLAKTFPKIQETFSFEPHYFGVYSQILDGLLKDPAYYPDAYVSNNRGIFLTQNGKKTKELISHAYEKNEKFRLIQTSMKLIRQVYDKLTTDELLFLMYITYPEYTEKSSVYIGLVEDRRRREALIESIRKKGLITEDRYKELMAMKF